MGERRSRSPCRRRGDSRSSRHGRRSRGKDDALEDSSQRSVATAARAGMRDFPRARSRSREGERRSGGALLTASSFGREDNRDKGGGKGKKGNASGSSEGLTPLPRPGVDDDTRFDSSLADDPRYFPGAELGKAQKAALGVKGLHGRNTASFEPSSTLVRPAMRVFYGRPQKRFGEPLKPDDVVIVPDFFCEESNFDMFDRVLEELKELGPSTDGERLEELPRLCNRAVEKLCKYFAIQEENRAVRLSWFPGSSKRETVVWEMGPGKFRSQPSKKQNCVATLALGDTRELAFRRSKTEESLFFPQLNGQISFFARDVCLRWQQGTNVHPQEGRSCRGHVAITVMGHSTSAVEENVLWPGPSDEKRGQEGFDGNCNTPCSDLARPSMRIITTPARPSYGMPLKHDDVVVVPEFFCKEDDWEIYYELLKEMRQSQAARQRGAEWISWHEGAHLLSKNPTGSATYQRVLDKMCHYFSIAEGNRGTRFNWYRDGSDWKPFHHDSAAFNVERAKNQNTTIGISFGASRELAFRHAKTGELIYFPQKNGMLFYFGKDANIVWQHGINALPEGEQDGKGRISIILWGLCTTVVDEPGSPPMLDDESRGKGKGKGKGGFSMHSNSSQACRDFQKGRCTYGDRCRFSHAA